MPAQSNFFAGYNPRVPPTKTDILIIGSGAREHALAWKLAQSPRAGTVYVAPGNAGTAEAFKNVDIPATNIQALAQFAAQNNIGLTVVGPDEPLSLGIVDQFKRSGLRIFGPTKAAAQIESSKVFAKKLMAEAKIPTAAYRAFTDIAQAQNYAAAAPLPMVVKASGLAAGKGVFICDTYKAVGDALDAIMVQRVFGDAGTSVVIEEFLTGDEISIHVMTDGVNYAMFPSAQDHKRVGEGDTGKNTGGMGVIAPVPWVTSDTMLRIEKEVIQPLIRILGDKGIAFQGVLFPGIMLTPKGPYVIELNARFGDPECQAYVRMLNSDLLDLIDECVDGGIGTHIPRWDTAGSVNVVLCSGGYPDDFQTGFKISGLREAGAVDNAVIFHAGTVQNDGVTTAGGRVLTVSTTGSPIAKAKELAYRAVEKIKFEGMYYRRDIGSKSITG
ncbi:MAG: phosphoribosylamine--glycine ligase [Candidatus Pacebacteria bacterium]|nr:phosphoribosylamine--glycine ligase [Candidatus Paceibacterota bacterium]